MSAKRLEVPDKASQRIQKGLRGVQGQELDRTPKAICARRSILCELRGGVGLAGAGLVEEKKNDDAQERLLEGCGASIRIRGVVSLPGGIRGE